MTRDEQWLLEEKYAGVATPAYGADKERLASGEPLAYVIDHQPFLGLTIYLDSHPLIPRVETEWWIELLLKKVAEKYASPKANMSATLTFLDLCAGSGAIGCTALARLPQAHVSFGEIDPEHQSTILKNIRENSLDESRADIRIGDLFEPFGDTKFDIIAANPPYIPSGRVLDSSVAEHEPALALFAEEDGLSVIRRIAKELPHHLKKEGEAWIEVDSAHAATACALFTAEGFIASIRTDQYGAPRVIVVSFP
jgi:HemK-like putative methylase